MRKILKAFEILPILPEPDMERTKQEKFMREKARRRGGVYLQQAKPNAKET
jgi:hypothetical protein